MCLNILDNPTLFIFLYRYRFTHTLQICLKVYRFFFKILDQLISIESSFSFGTSFFQIETEKIYWWDFVYNIWIFSDHIYAFYAIVWISYLHLSYCCFIFASFDSPPPLKDNFNFIKTITKKMNLMAHVKPLHLKYSFEENLLQQCVNT